MTVLFLRNASEGMRGYLRRWMIEPVGGVFVGRPTAAVRERIWRRAMRSETAEGIVLIYSASSDQGFSFRVAGDPKRAVTDLDGAHFPTMQEGEMPE